MATLRTGSKTGRVRCARTRRVVNDSYPTKAGCSWVCWPTSQATLPHERRDETINGIARQAPDQGRSGVSYTVGLVCLLASAFPLARHDALCSDEEHFEKVIDRVAEPKLQ